MALLALGKLTLGVCMSGASWSPRQSWFYIMCFGDLGPACQKSSLPHLWWVVPPGPALAESRWLRGDAAATRLRPLFGGAAAARGSCVASYHHADGVAHLCSVPHNPWHQYDFFWLLLERNFE